MAIKKRKIKTRVKPKPKPKSPHVKKCERLYKQLQAEHDDPVYDAMTEVCGYLGLHPSLMADMLVEEIISRFDAEIKTIQINRDSNRRNYRVYLGYRDRTKEPRYGYIYPSKYVVKSSHRLVLAATMAYVEICKHTRRFV